MRGFDPGPWAHAVWLSATDAGEPLFWFYPDGVRVDAKGTVELDLHGRMRWQGDADDLLLYGAFARLCAGDADRLTAQVRRAIERWAGTLCAPDERLRRLARLRDLVLREIELLRIGDQATPGLTPPATPASG